MRILVLEDTPERVVWLRAAVATLAEVVHCTTVTEFLARAQEPHEVVVFDHDLGLDLQTGLDAAQQYAPPGIVVAVVWSVNPDGTSRIVRELAKCAHVSEIYIGRAGDTALATQLRAVLARPRPCPYCHGAESHDTGTTTAQGTPIEIPCVCTFPVPQPPHQE